MARIARVSPAAEASQLYLHGKTQHQDNRNCSVVALSLVTGATYEEAMRALAQCGRKHGKGSFVPVIRAALQQLGFTIEQEMKWYSADDGYRAIIDAYPGNHKGLKSITTHHPRRFPAAWAGQPDMLMITANHICAFVDGEVKDWAVNSALQVQRLWVVQRKEG